MIPEVLYLILCDDVRTDPQNYHRLSVVGLLSSISSTANPPFPVIERLFTVLLLLTNCQGSGEMVVRVVPAQTMTPIFQTRRRQVRFVGDPAAVLGMRFHIRNCSFPTAEVYRIEVIYQGSVLARQKLVVKG